jgi:hypothetical protein
MELETNYLIHSLYHCKFAAGELVLEQPMAEVYRQVDAVRALNSKHVAMFFDVNCHKLIANFRCVLSRVGETKLGGLHKLLDVQTMIKVDFLALDALGPPNLVQALPKENHER